MLQANKINEELFKSMLIHSQLKDIDGYFISFYDGANWYAEKPKNLKVSPGYRFEMTFDFPEGIVQIYNFKIYYRGDIFLDMKPEKPIKCNAETITIWFPVNIA